MAHTSCPSGHDMWNGDGKPVVWAFRINYFKDFMEEHPECVLGIEFNRDESPYWQIYDCVDGVPDEDLDCWYCDQCHGLVVFVDLSRYDFKPLETVPALTIDDTLDWETYIALRDREFEDFQEFYEGMNPLEAIEKYPFKYIYKLSPDRKTIIAFDNSGKSAFGFSRSILRIYSPDMETDYGFSDGKVFKPFIAYKDKIPFIANAGLFAVTKDEKTILIKESVPGVFIRGIDINRNTSEMITVSYAEIQFISDALE